MDRLNHTFVGGFGGPAHAAKKYADRHPAYADAMDWAKAAMAAHKVGDDAKATWYAVQTTKLVSEGGQATAIGWIHRKSSPGEG